jgi:hypothetical protein
MADDAPLDSRKIISIAGTVALTLVLLFVASRSAKNNDLLLLAISMGAVGGVIHELAQSGGKIVFMKVQNDGLYLGTIAGMVLGAVAGVLAVRGQLQQPVQAMNITQLSFDLFLAGLALKGVAEAASTATPVTEGEKKKDLKSQLKKKRPDEPVAARKP